MELVVGDRPADRDHIAGRLGNAGPEAHVDRRLGRPVQVVQLGLREAGEETPHELRRQGLAARHHPGDGAEAHPHPRRADIDEIRQPVREHQRVEFPGFAVDVEISAREAGREQRRAEIGRGGEQRVDEAIFGAPQGQRVEPRGGQQIARIINAAVRRGEDERHRCYGRCGQEGDGFGRLGGERRGGDRQGSEDRASKHGSIVP